MSKGNSSSIKVRLSDTQLIALSSASQREDGAVSLPERIKGAAAVNLVASLIARGVVCEVRAAVGMPVLRRDEEGQAFALVITALGCAAINVAGEASGDRELGDGGVLNTETVSEAGEQAGASDRTAAREDAVSLPHIAAADPWNTLPQSFAPQANGPAAALAAGMPREGSKLSHVIGLLLRSEGASLDDLIESTKWLPHTTRAALTGLRKRGLNVERRREDRVTRYRIVGHAGDASTAIHDDGVECATPGERRSEAA